MFCRSIKFHVCALSNCTIPHRAASALCTADYLDEVGRILIMMRTILGRPEIRQDVDYFDLVSDFKGKYGLTPAGKRCVATRPGGRLGVGQLANGIN